MAANYWTSSQNQRWRYSANILSKMKIKVKCKFLSDEESNFVMDRCLSVMQRVGAELPINGRESAQWRQIVVSTAKTLFRRFYLVESIDNFDPRLMSITCLYLAAKVEEYGQYKIDTVLDGYLRLMRNAEFSGEQKYDFTIVFVQDYEFHLLEHLKFDLVIMHPYRDLSRFANDGNFSSTVLQTAWMIINDTYQMDVIFLVPPYLLALAALFIGNAHRDPDISEQSIEWFNSLNVSLPEIQKVVSQIMEEYASLRQFTNTWAAPDRKRQGVEIIHRIHNHHVTAHKRLASAAPNNSSDKSRK